MSPLTTNTTAMSQKHSNSPQGSAAAAIATHVIDLDGYPSSMDILKTSKQLLNAAPQPPPPRKESSSSESDCVEIVGVFPASNKPKYPKVKTSTSNQNSRSATPNSSINFNMDSSLYNSPTSNYNNNNNNNGNKKQMSSAAAPDFDVSKVVNVFKHELEVMYT